MTSSPYRAAPPSPKASKAAPRAPWARRAVAFAPRWLGGRALGERLKARARRLREFRCWVDTKRRFDVALERAEEARAALLRDPSSAPLFREASLRRDAVARYRTTMEMAERALLVSRSIEREVSA